MHELLGRLAAAEERFLQQEFLAPALRGGRIRVRIAGVVCDVRIQPNDFHGWGIFQPVSHNEARLTRAATLTERRRYLDLFPLLRLIVCRQEAGQCLCAAASFGDLRFEIEGLVPVELADAVQSFDVIQARHDGSRFWFDGLDASHSPATATYLRSALLERLPSEQLERPGLTAEERAAYELNDWELVRPAGEAPDESAVAHSPQHRRRSKKGRAVLHDVSANPAEQRLRASLSHAGARLIDYLERGDSYRVTYSIGGRRFTSAVAKDDLSVQVAGICLSGEDQKFDLSSLVGVLGEADGRIVPVGGEFGIDEEQYWHVHPPRNP